MALTYTPEKIRFGTEIPDFKLLGVNGKTYHKNDFINGKPLVVMFICNHCPYVKTIEERLIALGHELKNLSINVVAICANDEDHYPEDNFENLKKRSEEKKYPFYYLHDKTQSVAKAFGAVCTPDFFVYDNKAKLAYRGRLDDSPKDSSQVKSRELLEAVIELAQNKNISKPQIPSMGCSIKWIKND